MMTGTRTIKKIGASHFIKLLPEDVDYLQKGHNDTVDIGIDTTHLMPPHMRDKFTCKVEQRRNVKRQEDEND